jgi:hypothetical protein
MRLRFAVLVVAIIGVSTILSCKEPTATTNKTDNPGATNSANGSTAPVLSKTAGPLPDQAFKVQIACPDCPTRMRAGQVETIKIKVKNMSTVPWIQRGGEINDRSDNKFYIAAGNHWLDKDGKPTSETEGHNGIPKDIAPGEEIEMTLQITAPKTSGEWTLELDMVQEAVTWFGEKGSPTTKIKVTVVK